ncbi:MAG: Fic family protein [Clostridia bacterium]|nr:Fic family protein [Clostridia bacterium]
MANFFDKYELYTEGDSIYCYPGTYVLKNKLGLQEYPQLKKAETELVSARLFEQEINPVKGIFDKKHLYAIHRYLFQDIYDFAGKTRKEDISKGNTKFCVHIYVEEQLSQLFAKVKNIKAGENSDRQTKISFLAYLMAELNIIHPFREGNGRAIREFIRQYALKLGLVINWGAIERERLLEAMVASVLDISDLKSCLDKMIP